MSQVEKMMLIRSVMNLDDAGVITKEFSGVLVREIESRYKEGKK